MGRFLVSLAENNNLYVSLNAKGGIPLSWLLLVVKKKMTYARLRTLAKYFSTNFFFLGEIKTLSRVRKLVSHSSFIPFCTLL